MNICHFKEWTNLNGKYDTVYEINYKMLRDL
jgi:hypothetical protein